MIFRNNNKYFTGKYHPSNLNAIWLDKRSGLEMRIPKDFQSDSYLKHVLRSVFILAKLALSFIVKAPLKYKIPKLSAYRELYDNTLLFLLPSLNNQQSLKETLSKIEKRGEETKLITNVYAYSNTPISLIALFSLLTFPFSDTYRNAGERERIIISYRLSDFILAPGFIWFYFRVLERYQPRCVIMANDHLLFTKGLAHVCADLDIKTVYTQHASVSEAFPELCFSYSFLDGMDSFVKYTAEGKEPKGTVFLLGAARGDMIGKYRKQRLSYLRKCIGIGVSDLDNLKIIKVFCLRLLELYPETQIRIRTHPSMKNMITGLEDVSRITVTCAAEESIIDYLNSIDFQIASDSGIHLDAIKGGVDTIAYNFMDGSFPDNYGYVAKKILKLAQNFSVIQETIEKHTFSAEGDITYFDASYNTSYEGYCSDIIADFITGDCRLEAISDRYEVVSQKIQSYTYFKIIQYAQGAVEG